MTINISINEKLPNSSWEPGEENLMIKDQKKNFLNVVVLKLSKRYNHYYL